MEESFQDDYEWNWRRIGIAVVCLLIILFIIGVFFMSVIQNAQVHVTPQNPSVARQLQIPKVDVAQSAVNAKNGVLNYLHDKFLASNSAVGKFVIDVGQVKDGKKNLMDMLCDYWCKKK